MTTNRYFETHDEFLATRKDFELEIDRGLKVNCEDLETYLYQEYGPAYEVCQPREECNSDCVVRRTTDKAEFSARDWIQTVLKIPGLNGSNKSCLYALKWVKTKDLCEHFFKMPITQKGIWKNFTETYYTEETIN